MPAYVIARVWVKDTDGYEQYRQMVGPTIEQFGGRFLARGGKVEVLEGGPCPDRVIVLEFPDYDSALAWYSSPEYAPAKSQRIKSSEAELIVTQGV
jgi:uncharacterized protein (DUF1330 family)